MRGRLELNRSAVGDPFLAERRIKAIGIHQGQLGVINQAKTRAAVQKMLSWQPERIILNHGRWFDLRLCNARSDGRSSPLRASLE
jgi:hypothetical protein